MLKVGLGFKETRRIFSRWKLLQEKVIAALHGVSTSHPVAQTLHTLKCDIVPPLLQPALSICPLPCPSSWPAGIQVMNAQHSGLGMLLPAARGSKASFVSSQILLVWTKILFGHSNFGEKCYAHFTDSFAGSSSL